MNQTIANNLKEQYSNQLTLISQDWKADTAKYIRNKISLLRDDIMDALEEGVEIIVFTDEKESLNPLTKQFKKGDVVLVEAGNIPQLWIYRLDAMIGYAFDMGINLQYEIMPAIMVKGQFETYKAQTVRIYTWADNQVSYVSQVEDMTNAMTDEEMERRATELAEKEADYADRVQRFEETGEMVQLSDEETF